MSASAHSNVFLRPTVRHHVHACLIGQQYRLRPLVHFSPRSLNHHLHLILGVPTPPPSLLSLVQVLTGYSRHQSQRSEHSECPQSLDIEARRLPSDGGGAIPLGGLLQDRTEQPEQTNIRNVIIALMQIWERLKQRATDGYLIPSAATVCVDFSMCCHQAKVHLHLLDAQ